MNIEERSNGIILKIYVKPGSDHESLDIGNDIIFYTREKPERGKVNKALIRYLSRILKMPHENIKIVRGSKERNKILYIRNISKEEFLSKLREE